MLKKLPFKVFITRSVDQAGIDLLRNAIADVELWPESRTCPRDVLLKKAAECDALLTHMQDKIDAEVTSNKNLKIVSQIAVGTDNCDLKAASASHVTIGHTPGVLTEACADHAWALMLAAARRIVQSNRYVVSGKWGGADPMKFLGTDIGGRTIGVIGGGRIGQAIMRRASGFSMRVLYYDTEQKPELAASAKYCSIDGLLREADYVVLACPLTDSTRGMIGADQLRLMKKTAVLVNVARGLVVDTDALVKALEEKWIDAAALDVTDPEPLPGDHPLNKLDNCIVVSHIASATVPTRRTMAMVCAEAIIDRLSGKKIRFCANPEVNT